jgi:hypothetical protein
VKIITENGSTFTCEKAILGTPLATTGKIKFQQISEGKKLII